MRKRKTNITTREAAILKTAKDLFWKFGIHKVTVKEICREAGVSKMTFYRSFKNKNAVAVSVVDELIESGQREYEEIMKSNINFPEKVKKLITLKYDNSSNISNAFLKDLYQKGNIGLVSKMEKARANQLDRIKRDFTKAQKEGWINPDLSMDFILYMLNDLNHKIEDEQLLLMYTHPSKMIMDLTQFFFYGIANKD